MLRSPHFLLFSLVFALAGCGAGGEEPSPVPAEPQGPPALQLDAVIQHAQQFDEDLPDRPAGSQQEFAAATYLTAHLQRAGYEVRLASVPFKDLVRSTNVVALPPGGEPVEAVVTVLYDTVSSSPTDGRDLGVFLELARALRVREPEHRVQFVALGAEQTEQGGGNLGSRILAAELREFDPAPRVLALVVEGEGFVALGPSAAELETTAETLGLSRADPSNDPLVMTYLRAGEIFEDAEMSYAIAAGGPDEIARVVLELLAPR